MRATFIGVLFFSPALALAAGFATQSIFLSDPAPMVGETVRVHATVSNDAAGAFDGSVTLLDGNDAIGSVNVTLAAGAAETVSANWTPAAAGVHTLTARLTAQDGTAVSETSAEFSVAARPAPAASSGDLTVESSQALQQSLAQVSPQAAQAAQPAFAVIDGARQSAADALDNQLSLAKTKLSGVPAPAVLGTSTQSVTQGAAEGFWFILWTLYLYLLTILIFLVKNAALFYPLLVIVFFYILWRLFRRIRRPSY